MNKYYIVKEYELYDRDSIIIDTFITLNPDKYSNKDKYKVEPVKIKIMKWLEFHLEII